MVGLQNDAVHGNVDMMHDESSDGPEVGSWACQTNSLMAQAWRVEDEIEGNEGRDGERAMMVKLEKTAGADFMTDARTQVDGHNIAEKHQQMAEMSPTPPTLRLKRCG